MPEEFSFPLEAKVKPFWKLIAPVLLRLPAIVNALVSVQLPRLFSVPAEDKFPLLMTLPVKFNVPLEVNEPYKSALPRLRFPVLEAEPPD